MFCKRFISYHLISLCVCVCVRVRVRVRGLSLTFFKQSKNGDEVKKKKKVKGGNLCRKLKAEFGNL